MTTARILDTLLLSAVLFAGSAHAAGSTITMAAENGKPVARFTVGDSECVLKDDRVQCTPTSR